MQSPPPLGALEVGGREQRGRCDGSGPLSIGLSALLRSLCLSILMVVSVCCTPAPPPPEATASSEASDDVGSRRGEASPEPQSTPGEEKAGSRVSATSPASARAPAPPPKRGWTRGLFARFDTKESYSGDLQGLWDCDASHMYDGRPGFERVGCMVPMPGPDLKRALFRLPGGVEGVIANRFMMGAQAETPSAPGYDPDAGADEGPVRAVTLSPYWIQRMEVTIRQYRSCIIHGGCRAKDVGSGPPFVFDGDLNPASLNPPKEGDERPINGVTWEGARRYCDWIGGRLPTEAEWEFAARSGPLQTRYPWGSEPPRCSLAIYAGHGGASCTYKEAQSTFAREGHHTPSHILHQAGNLWEWTADWYAEDAYAKGASRDPKGPLEGSGRVQRGGSYSDDDPVVLRGAYRAQMDPGMKMPDVGFRCAAESVKYRPNTTLVDFESTPLSAWRGPPGHSARFKQRHGWLEVTLPDEGEVLRWRPIDYAGSRVLTQRIFPRFKGVGSVALIYGVQDDENHYRAEVYPEAGVVRLVRVLKGVEGLIAEASGLRLPRRWWLSLHLRWEGTSHRLAHSTLNLVSGEDATFTRGGVGFHIKGSGSVTLEAPFTTP